MLISVRAIRSFLGLTSNYRRFIKGFAGIAAPLHAATSVKARFRWDDDMQHAFEALKEKLCQSPVLAYPDFNKPFSVEMDASAYALGAVLNQKDEHGRFHPVQFASRKMNEAERNYSACEREALAVIFALQKFRPYLLSAETFRLITDHQALKYAFQKKDVHGRLARWLDLLAEYNFEVVYRPGRENSAADFLSRQGGLSAVPDSPDEEEPALTTSISQNTYINDLEQNLIAMIRFCSELSMEGIDGTLRDWVWRNSRNFLCWGGHLFRRTKGGVRSVQPISSRGKLMESFHDNIGHWGIASTRQFITDRYWWPTVYVDVAGYVKSCDGCQRSSHLPTYRTTMRLPVSLIFDVFSFDFAGPFPKTKQGISFLLVAVEHLTGWPIAIPCERSNADTVIRFVEEQIVHPFGPPRTIVSDNAT